MTTANPFHARDTVRYLRQPQANVPSTCRKAIQALSALSNLSLILEG